MLLLTSDCFTHPGALDVSLGITLCVGIFISYVPQYWSIIKSRSSDGVSYITMWLAYVSAFCTFLNVIVLKWDTVTCCKYLNVWQIIENLLPIEQLTVGPASLLGLFTVVVFFFDVTIYDDDDGEHKRKLRHQRIANILLILSWIISPILILLTLFLVVHFNYDDKSIKGYAEGLGIISSLVILVVWCPQIYTTYQKKSPGTLSIGMLLIQMPGSLIVVVFQAVFNDASWTTWLPYVITCIQLCILIFLWFWYRFVNKKRDEELEHMKEERQDSLISNAYDIEQLQSNSLTYSEPAKQHITLIN
eukprot:TRINITY_DN6433_c0_g1_i2.p1 TRINITY_DN6433_c0_g1~~TRINITY_DN6433_c0_g1_i2.p1  ORF type:complete len:304 (+),score=17.14 TRINITY_DN6433_c0_g1_i2:83-994(+)